MSEERRRNRTAKFGHGIARQRTAGKALELICYVRTGKASKRLAVISRGNDERCSEPQRQAEEMPGYEWNGTAREWRCVASALIGEAEKKLGLVRLGHCMARHRRAEDMIRAETKRQGCDQIRRSNAKQGKTLHRHRRDKCCDGTAWNCAGKVKQFVERALLRRGMLRNRKDEHYSAKERLYSAKDRL